MTGVNVYNELTVSTNTLQPVIPLPATIMMPLGNGWSQPDASGHNFDYDSGTVQYPAFGYEGLIAGATYRIRGTAQNFTGVAPRLTARLGTNTVGDLWNQTANGLFDHTGLMNNENDQLRFIANDNARTNTADIRGLYIERVAPSVGDYNPYSLSPLWTVDFDAALHRMEDGKMVNGGTNYSSLGTFNGMSAVTDGWIECIFDKLNNNSVDGSMYLTARAQTQAGAGQESANYIGVRSYQGSYQLYDRRNAAWRLIQSGIPHSAGENRVRLTVTGSQVWVDVDGVQNGPYTTQILAPGKWGCTFRGTSAGNVPVSSDYTGGSNDA